MARRRNRTPAETSEWDESDWPAIKAWYRERLAGPAALPDCAWPPVAHGPVWTTENGRWLLPDSTVGWDVLAWASSSLVGPGGGAWTFTPEQARFILWYYAVDDDGMFLAPTVVLQRCKGWGKDPLAGVIALNALLGPSLPQSTPHGVRGRREQTPWIRLLAVSQQQTENTMGAIRAIAPAQVQSELGIRVISTYVRPTDGSPGFITAITSNPDAAEGSRATLTICNETQNWTASNAGIAMMGVVRGDAAKSPPDRQARVLHICNAARVGVESVGLATREAWEQSQAGKIRSYGLMYDTLEAPPQAPLTADDAPEVVKGVRGDATWLSPDRIVQDVLDPETPPSESRRKWYNQVTAAEDAWVTREEWDACCAKDLPALDPDDELALFFDGGKSDDATAFVGCRISDGAVFPLGVWQRPPDARAHGWVAPREEIDQHVRDVLDHYNVVALWCDPSHAKDDETMVAFWDGIIDGWHRDYRRKLRLPASRQHATRWDMSDPSHTARFVRGVNRVYADIEAGGLLHDGDARLRAHVLHARRVPSKWGPSIAKNHRESRKKIDLAVAMVGARIMREEYRNSRRRGRGKVW
jgi:hypothetical protein